MSKSLRPTALTRRTLYDIQLVADGKVLELTCKSYHDPITEEDWYTIAFRSMSEEQTERPEPTLTDFHFACDAGARFHSMFDSFVGVTPGAKILTKFDGEEVEVDVLLRFRGYRLFAVTALGSSGKSIHPVDSTAFPQSIEHTLDLYNRTGNPECIVYESPLATMVFTKVG